MNQQHQLPLPFQLGETARFETTVRGRNGAAIDHLARVAAGRPERLTLLWGGRGLGKSHLLQATARAACGAPGQAVYVPLGPAVDRLAETVERLEETPLVCLDDLDVVAGVAGLERLLFDLVNRVFDRGGSLVVAHRLPPLKIAFGLADLASRLRWGPAFELQPLDDEEKLCIMQQQAAGRGFELTDEAGSYLLQRVDRDLHRLSDLIAALDRAALSHQRQVTLPFLRYFLGTLPG